MPAKTKPAASPLAEAVTALAKIALPDEAKVKEFSALPEIPEEAQVVVTLNEPADLLTFRVSDPRTYEAAGILITQICTPQEKNAKEFFEPLCKAGNALHKALTGAREQVMGPWTRAIAHLKNERMTWFQAEEKKREAENRRNAEEQRKALEAAKPSPEALAKQARELKLQGRFDEARALVANGGMPAMIPVTMNAAPVAPKTQGLSQRREWVAEITDVKAVCAGIAQGLIPESVIKAWDMQWPNAQADAMKQEDIAVPGMRGVERVTEVRR